MSLKDELLVVATNERKILVWDIRNMGEPLQTRDSLLKYQTRCLRVFPNKQVAEINTLNYYHYFHFKTFSVTRTESKEY